MPIRPPTHKPPRTKVRLHNPRGARETNRQHRRAMHTGSKGWKLQRARVLQRDGYTCQHPGCSAYGDQVDHINDNADELVTDDELQTLCIHHHSEKTMRALNAQARRPR